ncbi:MAG: SpoIIE family protein phosphatase [Calditrichaceae bacterium]
MKVLTKSTEDEIQKILRIFKRLYSLKSIRFIPNDQIASEGFTQPEVEYLRGDKALIKNSGNQPVFSRTSSDAVFPLVKNPYLYGLIMAEKGDKWNKIEKDVGGLITRYLTSLIDNQYLVDDIRKFSGRMEQLVTEMSALHEITRAFESGQNLQSLLEFIMDKCMTLMSAEAASLMLMVEDGKELEFKVALGPKGKEVKPFRLQVGKGIGGWVAQMKEAVLIPDAYKDSRFDPSFDKKSGFVTRTILCVPMVYQEKTIGVMQILNRKDGQPFNENDLMLFTIFATQAALSIENARLLIDAIEKERLEKELEVAAEIQRLIIPQVLPEIPGFEIAAMNIPCKQVGGDFYDIYKIDEDNYLITIADVSGKGVPGALVVSTMQATLKAYLKYTKNLVELTGYLNELIIEQTTDDRYITFFTGIYNTTSKVLRYINAGHNPPYLLRSGNEIIELKGGGIPVGLLPFTYTEQQIKLMEGDFILFYTDGLVEAMNPQKDEFGEERVITFLKNKNSWKPQEFIDELKREVGVFCSGEALFDDFTIIAIRK